MPDHLTRKELKQDNVALGVELSFAYFTAHRQRIVRIGGGVLALIVVIAGAIYYRNYEHDQRQQQLADAMTLQGAVVGAPSPTGGPSFPTEAAKKDAVTKAFAKLVAEHSGSSEAYIAEYSLGAMDTEAGKMADARRKFQDVADHADANYASLAKLSLAQLDFGENRIAEAQTILKDLADHPTDLVSKDQATITLARGLAPTKPEEARKLLLPIASKASEISQVAVTALTELPQK